MGYIICCLCTTNTGSGETDQLTLTFEDKLNMAIKIAEVIRYLHEECPGGPVVHGDLQPINIFLTFNFRPLVKIPNQKCLFRGFNVSAPITFLFRN